MGGISWLAQCALDFLIDERCHVCGTPLDDNARAHQSVPSLATPVVVFSLGSFRLKTRLLCDSCASRVACWSGPVNLPATSSRDALSRVYPVFVTDERLLALVHLLKFGRRERIAAWLAHAMAPRLPDFSVLVDRDPSEKRIVVPVPMDRAARRRRGFNQAERIARALSSHWNLPLEPAGLLKVRHTRAQSTLGREARLINLEGAFRADPAHVEGADVILVDDLVTTGATMHACARALRASGARQVLAVCAGYRDETPPGPGRFLNLDKDFQSE